MKQNGDAKNNNNTSSSSSGKRKGDGSGKYGEIELVIHPPQNPKQKSLFQQQTMRSVSSGSALPSADHSKLFSPWSVSGAESITSIHNEGLKQHGLDSAAALAMSPPTVSTAGPRTRESIERMKSMPSLKSAGAVPGIPNFDFSIPLPQNPLNFGGSSSLSASTG
ncbi:hypothetical protein EV177_010514, partial [Coemansia sp. RSA 1804]